MNDRDKQNPGAGSESDISKSQSGQQPQSGQQSDRATTGSEESGDQAATGQAQSGQFDQARSGQAADQAALALAFDRAAQLYQAALRWCASADPEQRNSLRARLADALANAGRGPVAGDDLRALRTFLPHVAGDEGQGEDSECGDTLHDSEVSTSS